MPLTPDDLLKANLPRSFRGFDENATADLIERAAKALREALAERDALQAKLDAAGTASETRLDRTQVEQMGDALLTAHRAAERILAEAKQEANALRERAAAERTRVLEQAQREIEAARAGNEQRIAELEAREVRLRRMLESHRQDLGSFVRGALDDLLGDHGGRELETELRERVSQVSANGRQAAGEQWSDLGARRDSAS